MVGKTSTLSVRKTWDQTLAPDSWDLQQILSPLWVSVPSCVEWRELDADFVGLLSKGDHIYNVLNKHEHVFFLL